MKFLSSSQLRNSPRSAGMNVTNTMMNTASGKPIRTPAGQAPNATLASSRFGPRDLDGTAPPRRPVFAVDGLSVRRFDTWSS